MVLDWLRRQASKGNNESHIVNIANLLFFVIVQTGFFVFIASKLEADVVMAKGQALLQLRKLLATHPCKNYQQAGCLLDRLAAEARMRYQTAAILDKASCHRDNMQLLIKWILPIVLSLTGVIILLVARALYNRHRHKTPVLTRVGFIGLLMVVIAYSTEVMFFISVVRRRYHLGDFTILRTMLTSAASPTRSEKCSSITA